MAAIQWGRKETIIFPPHNPIYSYGAVFLALVLTGFFVYLRFSFGQLPLQQSYTPIYVRAAAGGAVNKTDKYQLLYVGDGTKASRLATEDDVREGTTPTPGGKELPLALSPAAKAQGYRFLIRGAPQKRCLQWRRVPGNLQASALVRPAFAADAASVLRPQRHQASQADEVRATAKRTGAADAERVQPQGAGRWNWDHNGWSNGDGSHPGAGRGAARADHGSMRNSKADNLSV